MRRKRKRAGKGNGSDGWREGGFGGGTEGLVSILINVDDIGADCLSTRIYLRGHGFAKLAVIWFGTISGIAWNSQARSFSRDVHKVIVDQRPITSFTCARIFCMLTYLAHEVSAFDIGSRWKCSTPSPRHKAHPSCAHHEGPSDLN
jgi:hypothetical protein